MKKTSKKKFDIGLEGMSNVMVSAFTPRGGRYVAEIEIETSDELVSICDMHHDVVLTLRDELSAWLEAQ